MTVLSTRVTFDHVRNTAAGFTAANPVLGYGVTGVETDTGRQKVGDGVTAWSSLTYADAAAIQRANHTGTQPISTVSGLQAALDSKATPADVTAAVSGLVNSAPTALDTLNELAAALGNDANFAATVTTALAAKAPLASPTFTGTVSGVTKGMVGLGNVDNTADASKPVSTAQAAADAAVASAAAADATSKANAAQAAAVQRANHTGTQAASTISDFSAAAVAAVTWTTLTGRPTFSAVATSGSYADLTGTPAAYSLPTASATVLGGVKIGSGISIDGNGVISASAGYTLPNATTSTLGGVIVGAGLGVSSGTVSVTYGTTAGTACQGNDARLSDARTPTSHAASHQTGGADAINPVIVTPASLSASQNDYAPGTADIIRLSSSTAVNITGLAAPAADGALRLLINTNASGGANITLVHESASSTAANRFRSVTTGNIVLLPDGGSVTLTYSTAISRWRVL